MVSEKSGQGGGGFSLQFVALSFLLPYVIGYLISTVHLDYVESVLSTTPFISSLFASQQRRKLQVDDPEALAQTAAQCYRTNFRHQVDGAKSIPSVFVLHRNGQSESCGSSTTNDTFAEAMQLAIADYLRDTDGMCPPATTYEVESLLTRYFALHLPEKNSCTSQESYRSSSLGFYGYCDMGTDHTPILRDHHKLVRTNEHLPGHFHDAQGMRVTSFRQILASPRAACGTDDCQQEENAVHLYAVPAGRVFMHVASYVGQRIDLPHVSGGDPNKPVYLEVLSVSPAVFDLHNFFSKDESAELIERALEEKKESHRIKRSSTGDSGYTLNARRTSESGYDTDGDTSMRVKHRCFDVLGFDEYLEGHADGLQILRYNLTTAYIPHMDWFATTDASDNDDYDSGKKGGNRFATILLYMSDLNPEDGGETVFTEAWPSYLPENERVTIDSALEEFRQSGQSILKQGSWEEKMVAQCRTRLAIRPNSARAVLFYSLKPNGEPDNKSMHGACPVLNGQKYAANLWVWSTPRPGYPGSPKKEGVKSKKTQNQDTVTESSPGRILASFRNQGTDESMRDAKLYYFDGNADSFWGDLGPDDPPISINTFKGHVWRVKVGDELRKTWSIDKELPAEREFVI